MTLKSATDFLEKIRKDDKFREHFLNLDSNEERVTYAKESGFDFSQDELKAAVENAEKADVVGQGDPPPSCHDMCIGDLINRCVCNVCSNDLKI